MRMLQIGVCALSLWWGCLMDMPLSAQDESKQSETQQQEEKQDKKQEEKQSDEKDAKQAEKNTEQAAGEQSETGQSDAPGQGDAESVDPATVTDLEGLLGLWQELNAKLDSTKQAFDESEEPQELGDLRDEYVALIDEANALIERIKAAALERIESGDTSQRVFETIVGIMINDAVFERDWEVLTTGHQLINAGIEPGYFEKAAKAPRLGLAGQELFQELQTRLQEARADDLPRVKLTTTKGDIVLELFENEAPQTVGNFVSLIEDGYYDGIKFHRVIDGFVAQGGDPRTKDDSAREQWGTGGPGYTIYCECYEPDARRHFTGSLSMAKQPARDTGGSQFFITYRRTTTLDGKHTVFGRVVEGMEVAQSLQRIDPQAPSGDVEPDAIIKAEVLRKRDHEYAPTKVQN